MLFLSPVWALSDIVDKIVNQGDITVLKSVIPENQLVGCDRHQLRIIRNTILAQYGYIFKSEDLSNHFKRFSWYKPISNDVSRSLTPIDYQNIDLVLKYERNYEHLSNFLTQREKELIGFWHNKPFVSAGYDKCYSFYNNRIYQYVYFENEKYVYERGKWFILNNQIYLFSQESGKKNDQEIIIMLGPIEPAKENIAYPKKVKIGSQYFWKFSDDPTFAKDSF